MKNSYQQNNINGLGWLPIMTGILFMGIIINIVSGGFLQGLVSTPALASFGLVKSRELETQDQSPELIALKLENEQLRAYVHLASSTMGILAPITSTPSSSPYGTFTIGRGKIDGIQVDDIALSESGFAIGIVTEVSSRSSRITEVLSPRNQVDIVASTSAATLVGYGGGNGLFQLPRANKVIVGDIARAPLIGNYPVALVGHIESTPSSATNDVYVSLPFNLSTQRFVYVVQ